MAKSGLDFFRLDVEFDDNFELVCAEYGSAAFEVIVRLWQRIYKEGYYCEWNKEVALLFARRWSLGGSVVSEIVECAVRRGIFDMDMYKKHGILTSRRIQLNYLDGTERRKDIEVIEEYLLVSDFKNRENVRIKRKNVDRNSKNVNRIEQSNSKSKSNIAAKLNNKNIKTNVGASAYACEASEDVQTSISNFRSICETAYHDENIVDKVLSALHANGYAYDLEIITPKLFSDLIARVLQTQPHDINAYVKKIVEDEIGRADK